MLDGRCSKIFRVTATSREPSRNFTAPGRVRPGWCALHHTNSLKAAQENELSRLIKQVGPLQIRYEDGDSEDLRLQEYGTNLTLLFHSTQVSAAEVEQPSFLQVAAHLAAGHNRPQKHLRWPGEQCDSMHVQLAGWAGCNPCAGGHLTFAACCRHAS